MKRFLGVLVALAALGAAAASVPSIDLRRDARAQTDASRAADQALAKLEDALATQLHTLEPRVAAASSRPELMKILSILREADDPSSITATLKDAFDREVWWEPFRRDFGVVVLSLSERSPELVLGAETVDASALIQKVRSRGLASDTLVFAGEAWVAAGERISLPSRRLPAVLILAAPLNNDALEQISRRAGGAVMVSNGTKALTLAGPDQAQVQMAGLVGQETLAAPVTSPHGEWAAAKRSLGPGLWMWVYANTHASATEAAQAATINKSALFAGAGLLAFLSIFFAFRQGAPLGGQAPVATQTSEGTPPPLTTAPAPAMSATAPGMGRNRMSPTSGSAVALEQDAPSPYAATATFDPPARNSRVFGRYTIVSMLGEGGMAQVFTAITVGAEGFRRRFVVKRLRPELANESSVVAQFIDEAKLGSLMVHSNIIPVFDFGRVGDEYYLATEYILGRDLGRTVSKSIATQGRALSVPVILHVMAETLKALDYAHNRRGDDGRPLGVVHRDVSPSNILISAGGEVKLFDFGIVKAEGRVTQTEQGVVKGNVSFMSPEQARGTALDARADLFSLGLVMYYAAAGQPLYHGGTPYELLVRAATGPDESMLAQIASLPEPLNHIVGRALMVQPDQRYPNALAFLADVEPHVRNHAVNLAQLIQSLFRSEFDEEESRFSAALPSDTSQRPTASHNQAPTRGDARKTDLS
ncbi:MAG: serine/threonine-protein kinase [Deltaproteobacteria bacterium]|nr:serine/threonine-protein kinase [Deltaproteobacteria bacterium]